MTKNSGTTLFGNLTNFGFDNLGSISLYKKDENTQNNNKQCKTSESSPADSVFDRKVVCPVCDHKFTVRAVKTSSIRVLSRDTDFMMYYREPNPMFYDVWVCHQCGYAALSNKFNTILDKQKKLIKDNISNKWNCNKKYPDLYNEDIAIEMHQLALLNAVVKMARDSEKAMICLKLAWLYRLKKDTEREQTFLSQALKGFELAFGKEAFPIAGMDEATVKYLIGEIYRRVGDKSNALLWFSRVLSDRQAKPKVKDMARDQKDIIRSEECLEKTV